MYKHKISGDILELAYTGQKLYKGFYFLYLNNDGQPFQEYYIVSPSELELYYERID